MTFSLNKLAIFLIDWDKLIAFSSFSTPKFLKKYIVITPITVPAIISERGEVKLTEYEMQEITNNFQMGEYETWEIKSPFREGKTRYFREK